MLQRLQIALAQVKAAISSKYNPSNHIFFVLKKRNNWKLYTNMTKSIKL